MVKGVKASLESRLSEELSSTEPHDSENIPFRTEDTFEDAQISDEAWYAGFFGSQGNLDEDESDPDFWAQWDNDGERMNPNESAEDDLQLDEEQKREWEERLNYENEYKPEQTTKEIFVPSPDGPDLRMILINRQPKSYNVDGASVDPDPPNWAWEMWDKRDIRLYNRGRKRRRTGKDTALQQLSSPLKETAVV